MHYTLINTLFGKLLLTSNSTHLTGCYFENYPLKNTILKTHQEQKNLPIFTEAEKQLNEYANGTRKSFNLPLQFTQGTHFQKRVWQALNAINYGTTISYQTLAKQLNSPKSARPVGGAVGKNPIGIILPCHRVVGSNGSLTGFGGGLPLKEQLLKLEQTEV